MLCTLDFLSAETSRMIHARSYYFWNMCNKNVGLVQSDDDTKAAIPTPSELMCLSIYRIDIAIYAHRVAYYLNAISLFAQRLKLFTLFNIRITSINN